MCGIVGVVSNGPVNQLIYDALLLLQHRGQDAAGIVTQQENKFFMHKAKGMVKDVFRTRNMRALPGNCGLGQVRYPTAGNAFSEEEAQPFYVNAPFGIVLVHNGNLTNAQALKHELFTVDHRHINTESDSEVLLNVLAHEIERTTRGMPLQAAHLFEAVRNVHRRIKGSYAVIALIAGHGVLAFRDPFGIRPLCIGRGPEQIVLASESVALEGTMHQVERDVAPGEAVFIDLQGKMLAQQCADAPVLNPCIFEFVYLARPDSVMDGISVYQARLNLGQTLAKRVVSTVPPSEIDVVIPIPESSRPSAAQLAQLLVHALAAVNGQHMQAAQVLGIALEGFGHLDGQFTCGRQYQHLRREHGQIKPLQQRQREGSGLAGAGLGLAEQVTALQERRYAGLLDGRGSFVAHVGEGLQQPLVETEVPEVDGVVHAEYQLAARGRAV